MKKIIYLIVIFVLFSCSKNENSPLPSENKPLPIVLNDKPIEMTVFCQKSPNDTLRTFKYKYDNQGNLIHKDMYGSSGNRTYSVFKYNSKNQLIEEKFNSPITQEIKTYIYNDSNQLINIKYEITDYSSGIAKEEKKETPREYKNNLLVKEWKLSGSFVTYEYENGKQIKKVSHTSNGQEHHFTYYKYKGDLLIEEKKENSLGKTIYLKTYIYDKYQRLLQIEDRGNIVEENKYIDDKLIEKRTYYFGIDPGYYPCYGNYIYKYKY